MTRCSLVKASLNNMFVSVQGEGPLIGLRQAFLRFAGCSLSCRYCDTDLTQHILCDYKYIYDFVYENLPLHSVVLTGGEPLEQVGFLYQFLPKLKNDLEIRIFLETAGHLPQEMGLIRDYVDYISMDIKVPYATGIGPLWDRHRRFIGALSEESDLILKLTLAPGIHEYDRELVEEFLFGVDRDILCLVLQPVYGSESDRDFVTTLFDWQRRLMSMLGIEVRIIPQVHKFLGME